MSICRLGEVQAFRRPADIAFRDEGVEDNQKIQIKPMKAHPLIITNNDSSHS